MPATNATSWPRLLTLTIHSLETLWVYAPVHEQYRTLVTVNVDLPTILDRWGTLDRLMEQFDDGYAEEVRYGVRRHVLALSVEGARNLMRMVEVPGVVDAARRLNLDLMRKGICMQRRAHSFGLADLLLDPPT